MKTSSTRAAKPAMSRIGRPSTPPPAGGMGMAMPARTYDRAAEDMGNMVELGHVNVTVPDQQIATLFYVSGLGLTRDAYLMTGVDNMWINVGRGQFHLPTRGIQVLRGITGLVLPSLDDLRQRLKSVEDRLAGTKFSWTDHGEYIDTTCPWGNRIRCHGPQKRFGKMHLGMPYVEFGVPRGTLPGIKRFYEEIFAARTMMEKDAGGKYLKVCSGDGQSINFRETREKLPAYDGHHIQVTLANFSGPHRKLKALGLITEESDQWQYRMQDIIDLDTKEVLFTIEHEVRSMTHPMFNRPLMNRNPNMTNRNFLPGHDAGLWAGMAAE
jgi:predicted enzyme related to lactoylglutathione lyase